jgi:branched-chain amino acid transport system ATP-binding protein
MAEPALELKELEVQYGTVTAVRRLTLTVEPGEIVGLIGPNGAGKSTTLHAIMGLVRASGGEIHANAHSILGRSPEKIARAGLALVPEGRRIFGDFTVAENLRLGLATRKRRARGSLDRAYELFPILHEYRRRSAGELSGGQQQQLAIGRALVAEPDVLLLDEPSLGLAPVAVDTLFAALGSIRERGVSVLLIEQRALHTVALCDRTHVLVGGELRLTLTPADAADKDRIVSAYFAS